MFGRQQQARGERQGLGWRIDVVEALTLRRPTLDEQQAAFVAFLPPVVQVLAYLSEEVLASRPGQAEGQVLDVEPAVPRKITRTRTELRVSPRPDRRVSNVLGWVAVHPMEVQPFAESLHAARIEPPQFLPEPEGGRSEVVMGGRATGARTVEPVAVADPTLDQMPECVFAPREQARGSIGAVEGEAVQIAVGGLGVLASAAQLRQRVHGLECGFVMNEITAEM